MSDPAALAAPRPLRVLQPRQEPERSDLTAHYRALILAAGEQPDRQGLVKTPERAAKSWKFLTSGYDEDPAKVLSSAVFDEDYREMVLVKEIEFFSLCEHHLLPFFGKVHVAYIPDGRIVGLSKIPRLVDVLSRRLQVQERLTTQIAGTLSEVLSPRGIAVWIEASHLCMMMRGVEKQHSSTDTSVFKGAFEERKELRDLFLSALPKRG